MPDKASGRKHSVGAEQARPRRSDVESFDLRSLICRAERVTCRVSLSSVENVVKAVRVLEPGSGEPEIKLDGIRVRLPIVYPVEYVLLIALGMDDRELWWVEESACVQSTG